MSQYHVNELQQFVGGKVEAVFHDESKEYFGFVITLKNGKYKTIIFLRDDEGNGPGSFETTDIL